LRLNNCRAGAEISSDHPTFTVYSVDSAYAEYFVAPEGFYVMRSPRFSDEQAAPLLSCRDHWFSSLRLYWNKVVRHAWFLWI